MFEVFSRSWQITKLSFSVIKKDKELLTFPVLSGIFSLLFLVAIIFPALFLGPFLEQGVQGEWFEFVLLFLIYLGLAFIATFFNVATVYIVKSRFEGGDATFKSSLGFAFSKIHLIFAWSVVSAVVGLILRVIELIAQRIRGAGGTILQIIRGILGVAWSILTLFVVPVLVYKGLGPIDAIKESAATIKKTWGESLIREIGLGLVQTIFIIIGIIVFVLLGIALSAVFTYGLLVALFLGLIYVVLIILVFNIANTVYNTALYVYAQTGEIPDGFNSEVLANAFTKDETSQ